MFQDIITWKRKLFFFINFSEQLEEKMKWIKNFERVQEIQRQIVWPTVTELDPRCVIPEVNKRFLRF